MEEVICNECRPSSIVRGIGRVTSKLIVAYGACEVFEMGKEIVQYHNTVNTGIYIMYASILLPLGGAGLWLFRSPHTGNMDRRSFTEQTMPVNVPSPEYTFSPEI